MKVLFFLGRLVIFSELAARHCDVLLWGSVFFAKVVRFSMLYVTTLVECVQRQKRIPL